MSSSSTASTRCIPLGTQHAHENDDPQRENETPLHTVKRKKVGKIYTQFIFVTLGNCVDIFNSLTIVRFAFHFIF